MPIFWLTPVCSFPLKLSLYLKLSMPKGGVWLKLRIQAMYLGFKRQVVNSPGMYLGGLVNPSVFKIPHLQKKSNNTTKAPLFLCKFSLKM